MRRLLWRRSLPLVVAGSLHAVLLYVGDILAAYGVPLFVGAWMVRWLVLTALLFFVVVSLPSGDSATVDGDPPDSSMLPADVLTMVVERSRRRPRSRCSGHSDLCARSPSDCGRDADGSWSSRNGTGPCCLSRPRPGSAPPCSVPSLLR